ncbi:SPOR domain-containing protein [Microbulbifer litoralis]|uniref:SPOR domain-containing protein n=1 Tax=Microbulbifer litoralis TaxID=2933965 RepID=UPI002027723A|nr:SPOR domain-containing protein [Microbulbifer sp. GX H0434]
MASRDRGAVQRGRLNDGFRQRIVGALVLGALAVIFLPTLFDREGARYIDVTSQIPPQPDIQPIEIAEPEPVADAAPAPDPDDAFQPAVREPDSPPAPEKLQAAAETVAEEPEKPVEPQKPEQDSSPILDADGLPEAWVVQVAAYRDESRAKKLRRQLMDEGYKAYTRAVTTDKGRFVRVFVGPKVSRADARSVKRELDQLLGAETLVLRFKA